MPVLVTPATADLGRRLVARLLDEGGQVRAVTHDHVGELRAAGAIVATADPDDVGRLEAAMAQVHTVVHLPELLLRRDTGSLSLEVEAVVQAAEGAGVQRLIMRSLVGAAADADDPLRAALGAMEDRVRALPLPTIVVRTGLVAEAELQAVLCGTPLPRDVRDVEVGLVAVDAVVEVLARLDAARSTRTEGHVVFEASVAASTSLGTQVERWQAEAAPAVYLDAATVPLLPAALRGPWHGDAQVLDAWEFTGVRPDEPAVVTGRGQ